MQRLEVSDAVRPLCGSLGVKGLLWMLCYCKLEVLNHIFNLGNQYCPQQDLNVGQYLSTLLL